MTRGTGIVRCAQLSQRSMWTSVPQIPVRRTRIRTSLMPCSGSGTSSSHRPGSARLFTRARILEREDMSERTRRGQTPFGARARLSGGPRLVDERVHAAGVDAGVGVLLGPADPVLAVPGRVDLDERVAEAGRLR